MAGRIVSEPQLANVDVDAIAQLTSAVAGRYKIERQIGAGGMATVHLARDLRHNRNVALKLLNPELGAVLGGERFLAEIQVTANLQHPNLLPLFDSGEAAGLLYYVMPYVEGESLRARLQREKQLPVEEAISIASAIAGALDYAHSHGVIHRDLKPENVLLQHGQPVIADFGIALAVSKAGGARITQTGISLGTPQYMSPEQATGDRVVDGRTDIYSLGVMLYEMLIGDPPYLGGTAQAIIAKVLTERPRSARIARSTIPDHVEVALERALEKLPADRFATAREFADAIQGKSKPTSARSAVPLPARQGWRRIAYSAPFWAIAFAAAAATAGLEWIAGSREQPGITVRYPLTPPARVSLVATPVVGNQVAISPNGDLVAFAAIGLSGYQIFSRRFDELAVRPMPGTEGAGQPFFSPDGKWIGFTAGNVLKKVPAVGGSVISVGTFSAPFGAAWTRDGRIVVSTQGKLVITSENGGPVTILAPVDTLSGMTPRWPVLLEDGETILFSSWTGARASSRIGMISLKGGNSKLTDVEGSVVLGMLDGKLVYGGHGPGLMAVPFDPSRGRVTGQPVQVVDSIAAVSSGALRAALSRSGSLVYAIGGALQNVVEADWNGGTRNIVPAAREYTNARYSPDGKRIALSTGASTVDIWIYDIAGGTETRLTREGGTNDRPEWTRDGKRVLYRSDRDRGVFSVWWQPSDGTGKAEVLARMPNNVVYEAQVTPDNRYLIYRTGTTGSADIWYRALQGDTTTKPLAADPTFTEWSMQLSPDGHWLAYSSDESTVFQVYVRPFPGPGPRIQVSTDGGENPVWTRDSRKLIYVRASELLAASVTTTPSFTVTSRAALFKGDFTFLVGHAAYDVRPDGKGLLLLKPLSGESPIIVAHDWKYELRARMAGLKNAR